MSNRLKRAEDIVKTHTIYAAGGGLIPLPLVDFAAVTAVQLDMLKQLCGLYNVDYNDNVGKSWVTALAGTSLSAIGASFVKAIPFVGSVLGGLSMSALSGATTYGIGQVFITRLEEDGDIADFDVETAREAFETAYEEGKSKVNEWQEEIKSWRNGGKEAVTPAVEEEVLKKDPRFEVVETETPIAQAPQPKEATKGPSDAEPEDLISKLERLAAMRDKGLLSDEEFQVMKNKLLGMF
ncbi:MAG: DUF697 domain-containing protein [Bacteroidetes Order II. Incertae sedis bacterium]|nr:DUF697 domain-containing protein [Bacteroidetes Order II. bacterium]